MDKPVMTMYKKLGEEPWVIRSERSTSLAGGDTVLLRGKVLVTREGQKNGGLKIVTSNVKYIPDKDYAETRENVLMLSKDDETSATGAQVYFEPVLKINLLADVRRKHETQ
jgi:lipopolysaccharide export system protein LptC